MLIPKNSLAIIYSDIWGGFRKRLETSADSGEKGSLINCWRNRLYSVFEKEGVKESVTFCPEEFKHV